MGEEKTLTITYMGETLNALQEALESYLGIITFNYINGLMALSQGDKLIAASKDDTKNEEVKKEMETIKEDLLVLDIAIPRVTGLLEPLNKTLGIEKTYETALDILNRNNIKLDETVTDGGVTELQDGVADNEQDAEISKDA